jgi:hypothetical protein
MEEAHSKANPVETRKTKAYIVRSQRPKHSQRKTLKYRFSIRLAQFRKALRSRSFTGSNFSWNLLLAQIALKMRRVFAKSEFFG